MHPALLVHDSRDSDGILSLIATQTRTGSLQIASPGSADDYATKPLVGMIQDNRRAPRIME